MSARVQQWIHFIEEGGGARLMRMALVVLGFIALAVIYNVFCFRNFGSEEAMDLSQLARNIARGKGFATDYVRPLSITRLESQANKKLTALQRRIQKGGATPAEKSNWEREQSEFKKVISLKVAHPDLANAPGYPLLLAGLMKVAPIDYQIPKKAFSTYAPELWIAACNQFLFFVAVLVLFQIAQRLFDRTVGLFSALLFASTELFWRFSISGLPTLLLVLIFLCLAWSLLCWLHAVENSLSGRTLFWSMAAGILLGAGCLTRYSFGSLWFATLVFLILFGNAHRLKSCLLMTSVFLLVISPWLVRNHSLSGNWFGTAAYALCENTPAFPENQIEKSLSGGPVFAKTRLVDYIRKLAVSVPDFVENEIPRLGGNWLSFLFLAGLLIPMASKEQARLRIFVLVAVAALWIAQSLGRSHLSNDSPQFNSENLLILVSPVAFIFGVAFYFNLIRKIVFPERIIFYAANVLFCVVISAPLIFALLPPSSSPIFYPYNPPLVQESSGWMRKNELVMSDVPWAVAWYGNRQSVPLSISYPGDFLKINDDLKPIQALYLSPKITDSRFLSQLVKDRQGWGRLVLEILARGEVPNGFPLKHARSDYLPSHVFLTDWERWANPPRDESLKRLFDK